jgi:hypothetical protein
MNSCHLLRASAATGCLYSTMQRRVSKALELTDDGATQSLFFRSLNYIHQAGSPYLAVNIL